MKHSIDFFRDEIRNGFYIPTQVKMSWACDLDVLSEIDRICRKHNITYFADWGTFLGAVRHGGFIPWDDDMDICMIREDYKRFREVADAELPEGYVIHDYERQDDHWLFLARIVRNSHISFDEKYLSASYNFPWLSGVDIFIKDYLYADPEAEKARDKEVLEIIAVADGIMEGTLHREVIDSKLERFSKLYHTSFPSRSDKRALRVALYSLAEKQMGRTPEVDSDRIGQIFPWVLKGNPGEPKSHYKPAVYIPFEDTMMPVPSYYNELLTARYHDYNTIRKGWGAHEYPAFEEQRKSFENETGAKLPRFEFISEMLERCIPDKSSSYKELAKECLTGLHTLLTQTQSAYTAGEEEQLAAMFGEMQQLAVDMGTLLESVKGEDNPRVKAVVGILEKLCDDIYTCSESLDSNDCFAGITGTLRELDISLSENILNIKTALFLPIGIKEWKTMKRAYNRMLSDPAIDPIVVPLPLYTKDVYGRPTMTEDKILAADNFDAYASDLPLAHWYDYDISLHCPEIIYIQSPYDGENPLLTVPPTFYAQNLVHYTDRLVYMPIGTTGEFGANDITDQKCMMYYVTVPGVIYADEIIVQSENTKAQYVNKLAEFAGEGTRSHWERAIISDKALFTEESKKPGTDYTSKHILYCISLYEFTEHSGSIIDAVKGRLDTFASAKDKLDAMLCFYPETYDTTDTALLNSITSSKSAIISEAQKRGIETIPLSKDIYKSLADSFDAYYGSSSPLVHEFVSRRKPVMISNYDI